MSVALRALAADRQLVVRRYNGTGTLEFTPEQDDLRAYVRGTATVIDRHGSTAQKETIFPRIAAGEHRIALSFTEPGEAMGLNRLESAQTEPVQRRYSSGQHRSSGGVSR